MYVERCYNDTALVNGVCAEVLFHGGWLHIDTEWHNPDLKNRIVPIFAIRDSIIDALGSASPSGFSVIIYASPLLDKYLSVSGVCMIGRCLKK